MLCREGDFLAAGVAGSTRRVNMDAHLIGIDLAHLVIRLNEHPQNQPVKATTAAERPTQRDPAQTFRNRRRERGTS